MPLETAQNIGQLDESNPKTTDLVSQSGDHIRLIKTILKKTFPNFTTPLAASAETLDKLASGKFGTSDFTGHKLTGIVKGETDTDAVNVAQLAEGLAKAVKDANGAAWGDDKSAGGHALKDLKEAQSDNQATPLSQVTRLLSEKMIALQSWASGLFAKKAGDTFTGPSMSRAISAVMAISSSTSFTRVRRHPAAPIQAAASPRMALMLKSGPRSTTSISRANIPAHSSRISIIKEAGIILSSEMTAIVTPRMGACSTTGKTSPISGTCSMTARRAASSLRVMTGFSASRITVSPNVSAQPVTGQLARQLPAKIFTRFECRRDNMVGRWCLSICHDRQHHK